MKDTGTPDTVDRLRPIVSAPVLVFAYLAITVPVPEATPLVEPITTSAVLVVPPDKLSAAVEVRLMLTSAGFAAFVA